MRRSVESQCRSLVAPQRLRGVGTGTGERSHTQAKAANRKRKKVKNVYNNKIVLILYYI